MWLNIIELYRFQLKISIESIFKSEISSWKDLGRIVTRLTFLHTDARSFFSPARYKFEPRTVLPLHATRGFKQFGKQIGNRGDVARSICVVARLAVLVCCMTDDCMCSCVGPSN